MLSVIKLVVRKQLIQKIPNKVLKYKKPTIQNAKIILKPNKLNHKYLNSIHKLRHFKIGRIAFRNLATQYWKSYGEFLNYINIRLGINRIIVDNKLELGDHQNNGSSNAIFSVKNHQFADRIIVKQPLKISHEIPKSSYLETEIYQKIGLHPNILQFINVDFYDLKLHNDLYKKEFPVAINEGLSMSIALEKMDYNLEEVLKLETLSVKDRCDILAQVCEAVHYIYKLNIVHRDIKLNNILVNMNFKALEYFPNAPKFIAKLADFDCALDITKNGNKRVYHSGNGSVIPPEVYEENRDLDLIKPTSYAKADFWALGILFYELFGSNNPFNKNLDKRSQYSKEDLPAIPSAPILINKLARELLNRNPFDRYVPCICSDLINTWKLSNLFNETTTHISSYLIYAAGLMCQMPYTAFRLSNNEGRRDFVLQYVQNCQYEEVE